MRSLVVTCLLIFLGPASGFGRVVVFWQEGFPTVASQPVATGAGPGFHKY
jgi:hypothetical protein